MMKLLKERIIFQKRHSIYQILNLIIMKIQKSKKKNLGNWKNMNGNVI